MTGALLSHEEEQQYLELNKDTLKFIQEYVGILAKSKYRESIKTLQSRNVGYEVDDFIQDGVQRVITQFKVKTFISRAKLKKFIQKVLEYHYLKEKRKYFYTKQRGFFMTLSIEESAGMTKTIEDTLCAKETDFDLLDLQYFEDKNLYIICDWKKFIVCKAEELKKHKIGYAVPVNYFIQAQRELGLVDTCKHFKERGFYMTRKFFNDMSQAIIDYAIEHEMLEKETSNIRQKVEKKEDTTDNLFKMTCTCGYTEEDLDSGNSSWQCPDCGKIYDKSINVRYCSNPIMSSKPSFMLNLHKTAVDNSLCGI